MDNKNANIDTLEQYIVKKHRKDCRSGIIMLHEQAGKCRVCREQLGRLHYNYFHFTDSGKHGSGETWYYCDCACGHGTITGWYRTKEAAINAWNKGVKLNQETALVEGRTEV